MYKEFIKRDDIIVVTVLLGIMMTISSNAAICERGFSCMKRKMSVLQKRLGDYIMRINDPSLENFETEKIVFNRIESAITSRHLNGYNSSRTETHEVSDENVIVLQEQSKIKLLQDYSVCVLFSYLDDVTLFFSTGRYELLDCYKCG